MYKKTMLLIIIALAGVIRIDAKSVNERNLTECETEYRQGVSDGDKKALKSYITQCEKEPKPENMVLYRFKSYKELSPKALVCLGDTLYLKGKKEAFIFYVIAYKLGDTQARDNIATLLHYNPNFDKKLLNSPLSLKQETLSTIIADAEREKKENFLSMTLKLKEHRKISQKERTDYYDLVKKRVNECTRSIAKEKERLKNDLENIHERMAFSKDDKEILWLNTQELFLEEKLHSLDSSFAMFEKIGKRLTHE